MEMTIAEHLKAYEKLRQAQIRKIREWEKLPEDSIYRRNEANYKRFLEVMRGDLRLIEHSIKMTKDEGWTSGGQAVAGV